MNSEILSDTRPTDAAETPQTPQNSVTPATPGPVAALAAQVADQDDAGAPEVVDNDGTATFSAPDGLYVISRRFGTVLFKAKDKDGNIPEGDDGELVCSYVEIVSHLYAPQGHRGQWLMLDIYPRFSTQTGNRGPRERCMVSLNPYGLVKEVCSLVDRGLRYGGNVGASRPGSRLAQFVQAAAYAPTTPVSTLVDHYGWLDATGRYFAIPGRVISGATAPEVDFAFPPRNEGYTKIKQHLPARVVGTAAEWRREVWPLVRYSTPAILAICVALSGCMVEIVGERMNPIVHFYGQSELGKSTIARAATSVWGGRLEYFNSATQGLENIIKSYDGFCAVIDEIADGSMGAFLKRIYPVASGEGREGATPDNKLREAWNFFLSSITTGEKSVADISIKINGRTTTLGEESRVLGYKIVATIREGINLGVFDRAPEGETRKSLVAKLKKAVDRYRGAIGVEYIQSLVDEVAENCGDSPRGGLDDLQEFFDGFADDFRIKVIGDTSAQGVRDREIYAFARFALTAFKARSFRVLPPLDDNNDDPYDLVDLIAECCRHCIARETGAEARLDGCIADLLRVRPNQTDCYFSDDPTMQVNHSPYSRDLKCEAAVCWKHRGAKPTVSGEVPNAVVPVPAVLFYSDQQFSAVVDRWECNTNQVLNELVSRGVVYVTQKTGTPAFRTRTGRFGLGHRNYIALSVGASEAEDAAGKKAAVEEMNRALRGEPFKKAER